MAAIVAAALVRRSAATTSTSSCITYLFPNHYCYFVSSSSLSSAAAAFSTKIPPSQITFTPDFFVQKYQFSPELASKLASASARMHKPQNPDLLLSFLRQSGFSNAHLDRVVKHHPRLLSACVETGVKPKIKIFHDLGFSAEEAAEVVARDFNILYHASNSTIHKLSVLKGVLGLNDNVIKLIKRRPCLFRANPEKTLLPNIEFLKSCGVQLDKIDSCIYTYPRLFFVSPENVRRAVDKADEMGVLRSSRMFFYAVEAISHMPDETLELKLKIFHDMGFPDDDILRLFRSNPAVLVVSAQKINEVKEVLLETKKYDMSSIIKCPLSLMFSVEKRYKPRLQVLEVLERKSLIKEWPGLSSLCKMSNKSFFKKFVAPNMKKQPK